MILPSIETPADLRPLSYHQLDKLSDEIREFIISSVTKTGGHLGSNLGVVELTIALHRVFDSPHDILLWDTGHQAYVHKLLTGRRYGFKNLRQRGGMSGYPNRSESQHDWIESSHASTALSYAHGLAVALEQRGELAGHGGTRHVVAVVGDGSLTGGMAYEALNNLGHSNERVVIVLNDNGRSYAPTVSKLSESLTSLRMNRRYLTFRERLRRLVPHLPRVGKAAYYGIDGFTSVVREMVDAPYILREPRACATSVPSTATTSRPSRPRFEVPRSGTDPSWCTPSLKRAAAISPRSATTSRCTTTNCRPPRSPDAKATSFTEVFSESLVKVAAADERIVAITAAMAGPTGLLDFERRYPERFFDVGIAEQHAVTAAAGMAMGGLKPIVAMYSTFFSRAFDQAHLDVGLLNLPVVFVFKSAGITGDDGPSHHGLLDIVLCLAIPNMTIFAPSTAEEIPVMLDTALSLSGPSAIRYPKTDSQPFDGRVGEGLDARRVVEGDGSLCVLAVGKMAPNAYAALERMGADASRVTLYDVRVLPPDPRMIDDALRHERIITVEDATRHGGAGTLMVSAVRLTGPRTRSGAFPTTRILGVPRVYLEHHKPDELLAELGLDPEGLAGSLHATARRPAGVPAGLSRDAAPQLLLSRPVHCFYEF